ncbi:hypothetical protein Dsin_012409 [Dipteronia sinensis]|uniref:Reverse transcriptase domain-containing protein n=1 Tax=Dipteronia sinensis TaxID=43782 RepID=A0AAE0E852_9ROSI|nr:hypothetical protein Dsin_012409 [Dipteronia sinensis]
MWVDHLDFMDLVRRVWSIPCDGRPPHIVIVDQTVIRDHIVRFYVDMFSSDSDLIDQDIYILDDIVPSLVSQEENSLLVAIPSADVIHDAVFSIDALSAPGPNGFSGELRLLLGLYLQQFGFIRDRHVEDCIALASDCVNVLHKKCYGGNVAMKINIRKAFDTLDWKFLCRVLRAFGFSQTFMDWIISILGSSKLSVLINGSPAGYFGCSRGGHGQKPEKGYACFQSLWTKYVGLIKDGIWLIGENSQRDFWLDNWLGVPSLDLYGIPDFMATHLHARVSDFIRDGRWILDGHFRARFPDLCFRIGRIAISPMTDYLVWPRSREVLSLRLLLDRLPTEDRLCRSEFQLASRCSVCGARLESVDHLFLKCPLATALWEVVFSAFQRRVFADTWGFFSGRPCLFLSVIRSGFCGELLFMRWFGVCGIPVTSGFLKENLLIFRAALSLVWLFVYVANRLGIGYMGNYVDDLLILCWFGLSGRPGKAPVIRSVVWSPLAPGWINVITDGTVLGSPGVGGCGGVFRTCRSFVKARFTVSLGQVFAFAAELLTASLAINYAWNLGWHRIWLEVILLMLCSLFRLGLIRLPGVFVKLGSAAFIRSRIWSSSKGMPLTKTIFSTSVEGFDRSP